MKDRCFKALNLLRVIAHKDWGADCATLLKLYRSHVRSKLDYGCVVYGSARKSVLESLDRVQNAALRTCLGAFRTSPVSSLHVEAGELPPDLRRQQLSLQYISKLRSNPCNPTFRCVFGTAFNRLFEARPHIIPTLGTRMHQSVLDSGINFNSIAIISTPYIPPWTLKPASFDLTLHLLGNKTEVTPNVFQSSFNELVSQYEGYTRIFTDGSQIGEAVGAAAIVGSQISKKRLPNGSSIFSAEARGLLMALDMVHQSADRQLLFLSDSLSCLQSLKNRDMSHPLIADILCRVHTLISHGTQVAFMWVPSHVGLAGNSAADIAAKAALLLPISNLPVPPSDFCSLIRSHSLKQWQERWSSDTLNKLHAIEPKVNVFNLYRLPRRDEIIIHRLRIGHSFLTHGHLLRGETCPRCPACDVDLTVEHILLQCVSFAIARERSFHMTVTTLSELFSKVSSRSIIEFIKKTGLYRKI